jgi:PKD repeat protein
LFNPPKTTTCGSGQGIWDSITIDIPASASTAPYIKIGFRWVNNDDGAGSDPSVAIDNIKLFEAATNPVPLPGFTADKTNICAGECVAFTDQSSGSPSSWLWNFQGAASSNSAAQNPASVCYPIAGIYPVSLTATNANGSNTTTQNGYITVNPIPTVTISQNGNTLSTTANGTYQWFLNGQVIPNAMQSTYTISASGTYYLTVTSNGCSSASSSLELTYTGLYESIISGLKIYPNPISETLFIENTYGGDISLNITDIFSRMLVNEIKLGLGVNRINLSNLPKGIYFATYQSCKGIVTQKILKE